MADVTDEVALRKSEENIASEVKKRKESDKRHLLKKRTPFCFSKRRKDIYVSNKTNFKAYLNKCEKLLDSGETELIIHGLGGAISRACNLALQLEKNHCGTLELDINTSTIDLIDDLEPLHDDEDYEISNRQNSSIHIRVFRTVPIASLKFEK